MREAFHTPVPRIFPLLLTPFFVLVVIQRVQIAWTQPSLSAVITAVLGALLGLYIASAAWNHRRPVLGISEDAITWGSVMAFRPSRLALAEVEGIAESSLRRVLLSLRSGGQAKIPLRYVRKSEREAARLAIERAVAARGGGPPSTA